MLDKRKLLQVKMALFFGFALVIVGAFMPWSEIGPIAIAGTEGDGMITLILAIGGSIIGFFDKRPRGMLIAVSVAALALIISLVDYADLSGNAIVSIGAGLYVTMLGAFVATVAGGVLAFNLFKKPAASTPVPAEELPPGPPAV